ncbi:MAG: polysulfide reductase [Acidobacteria bacterium]|nr:polysulfide reductase [Acidobacteriota bacterium]
MTALRSFLRYGIGEATRGGPAYHLWMALLTLLMCVGLFAYCVQLDQGLAVTGMRDQVSWGFYISNFAFLVGIAAAAVILVMPAYVLEEMDFKRAVLIGEAVAVAAVLMAIAFVVVDVGGPARLWHVLPGLGRMNFPRSMLAWDILVLNGYLVLNLGIPFYLLFTRFRGHTPDRRRYVPFVFLSILWAVSLHLVTAFLFAGLPARPYWHSALLGPRFLATAFTAGPALIILILVAIRRHTEMPVADRTIEKLAMIVTVAAQVCCVMSISEIFTETYRSTHHSHSARYLFFGLDGHNRLVPWIWSSLALQFAAAGVLSVHRWRQRLPVLLAACSALVVAIEIEKGMGTIIPGFVPEPWGKVVEYAPTWVEFAVGLGIFAMGAFVFTVLAKVAIPVELGKVRYTGPV